MSIFVLSLAIKKDTVVSVLYCLQSIAETILKACSHQGQ